MSHRKSKKSKAKPAERGVPREQVATKERAVLKESVRREPPPAVAAAPAVQHDLRSWVIVLSAILLPLTLWAYWPTFVWMEDQWRNEPDYSHGYLIIPLALFVLYHRRDLFPGVSSTVGWAGFGLLFAAIALRVVGRMGYMDFLDGWTLVLWVGGILWIFGGWPMLRWALPAVAFLVLLVPLPYHAESLLSWRLQGVSTTLSVGALQTLGYPAISEGHTIWLDEQRMLVEEACSGMRIFVGMGAMGYLFAVLARRAWIDKWIIIASALPIAVFVNVVRVTATILAFHYLSREQAHVVHDFLGLMMVILGALLLAGVKSYWEHLYRPFDLSLELRNLPSMPVTATADGRH